ncbi:hypothetical protein M0R04_04875 [Candidatus Dojkabacteria bacterium]|jgi:hypothetical protein|nr:hypothetical protein [Candidatus Dojkabacteria bacterium]
MVDQNKVTKLTPEDLNQLFWYIERTSDYYGRRDYFENRKRRILNWIKEQRNLKEGNK